MASKDYSTQETQETPSQTAEMQQTGRQAQEQGTGRQIQHDADKLQLLKMLVDIAAEVKSELQGPQPKPFDEAAIKAVEAFNDIVSGLQFKFILVPPILDARKISPSEVYLSWTDTGTDVEGYRIERSKEPERKGFVKITQLGPDIKEYKDTKLDSNTTYHYRLTALNSTSGDRESNIVEPRWIA